MAGHLSKLTRRGLISVLARQEGGVAGHLNKLTRRGLISVLAWQLTVRLEICQKIYRTEDFRVKNLHRKRVIFDIC